MSSVPAVTGVRRTGVRQAKMSAAGVTAWRQSWPASGLRDGVTIEGWWTPDGQLVDAMIHGAGISYLGIDKAAVHALLDDVYAWLLRKHPNDFKYEAWSEGPGGGPGVRPNPNRPTLRRVPGEAVGSGRAYEATPDYAALREAFGLEVDNLTNPQLQLILDDLHGLAKDEGLDFRSAAAVLLKRVYRGSLVSYGRTLEAGEARRSGVKRNPPRREAIEVYAEKHHPSGDWLLSAIVDGRRYARRYIGYTKRTAIATFKREVRYEASQPPAAHRGWR